MAEADPKPSWWQTAPGILTAAAAVVTALTGLVVALRTLVEGVGCSRVPTTTIPVAVVTATTAPAAPPTTAPAPPLTGGARALPAGAKVRAGPGTYEVLAATLDAYDDTRRSLTLRIRYTRGDDAWAGGTLMDENFRLLVDGVPRSPTKAPNETVAVNSATDADVVFLIPMATASVVLQVGQPAYGTATIPIDLTP